MRPRRYLPKPAKGTRVTSLRPVAVDGCPNCGKDITPGRKHSAQDGLPCKGFPVTVALDSIPAVAFTDARHTSSPTGDAPSGPIRYARGKCHRCGTAVTGERWYCGACLVLREEERRAR